MPGAVSAALGDTCHYYHTPVRSSPVINSLLHPVPSTTQSRKLVPATS
jgi:hypothetical protein